MGVRWIRLDTTWGQSEWLSELPPASRLAWVELLCYVKSYGVAGSVKKPSPAHLARIWGLSKSSVEVMLAAASHDSALVQDGEEIIITGWSNRQSDPKAAERMRAYRERLSGESADSPLRSVTPVTRNSRNSRVGARAGAPPTLTETLTRTSSPPYPRARAHASKDREDVDDLEREITKHQPQAKANIIAIHGGTEDDVEIAGHRVGVGIEIDAFKRLCRSGHDPPNIIAAAIAHIPSVSELQPPVSLARWGAADGVPIYERCVSRAYKEAPV